MESGGLFLIFTANWLVVTRILHSPCKMVSEYSSVIKKPIVNQVCSGYPHHPHQLLSLAKVVLPHNHSTNPPLHINRSQLASHIPTHHLKYPLIYYSKLGRSTTQPPLLLYPQTNPSYQPPIGPINLISIPPLTILLPDPHCSNYMK